MKKFWRAVLAITCTGVLFTLPLRADAAENPSAFPHRPQGGERGASVGFRAGYGKAFGDAVDSTAQSSLIQGMIPFWVPRRILSVRDRHGPGRLSGLLRKRNEVRLQPALPPSSGR